MRKSVLGLGAMALMASAVFANDPGNTQVAASDKSSAAFSKLDTDKDGRISAIEAANDSKVSAAFTQADMDKDGYLSREEFKSLSSGSAGRMPSDTMPPSSTHSDTTTAPSDSTPADAGRMPPDTSTLPPQQ